MKRLRTSLKTWLGYTLAEIIIVMLVVAVIVAVTIGVTKHKLDSIITYTYYSAYSTLRTATSQILSDYDPTDDRYHANAESSTLLAKVKIFFETNFGMLAVSASELKTAYISGNLSGNISGNINSGTVTDNPYDGLPASPGLDDQRCCGAGAFNVNACPTVDNLANCTTPNKFATSCKPYCYTRPSYMEGASGSTGSCPSGYKSCTCTTPGAMNMGVQKGCCCRDGDSDGNDRVPDCSQVTACPADATPQYVNGACSCVCNDSSKTFNASTRTCEGCLGQQTPCSYCENGYWKTKICPAGQVLNEILCKCVSATNPGVGTKLCLGGKVWNGTACVCPDGKVEQDGVCVTPAVECTGGRTWNGTECVCPDGQTWNGSQCVTPDTDDDETETGTGCSGTAPCGKQCDPATNNWVDIPGFSRECDEAQNKIWSESQCACVPSTRTITLNGQKYCEYLVSLLNTKANGAECTGPAINSTLTSFSGKIPDITLRNGMRLYNVRQNPQAIADLVNNTEGGKTVLNGVEVDTNKWGYTVYIDVDGEKGASEKWVDVYPFYVTLSGMVIPAYDKDHSGLYGGDSRNHMQVSIENEIIHEGRRKIEWLAKSVSYKEAACGAGYVGANTPYCKNGNAVSIKSECASSNSLCRLKYVKPIKFFF